jgi:excinuclease ABC subunit C
LDLPDKVKQKLHDLPDAPGCYMMRDRQGRIVYVGKAASLRKRVQSYFRAAALHRGTPKLRSLVHSVHDLDWIVVRNEAAAVLTEGQLIKDYRPRYNVSFRDDKRFLLLRAETGHPFPQLRLRRIRLNDDALYFGPYASSAAARATLDFAEKTFGLRKCAPPVPDAETHRHCLDEIVRYCSAPCIGKVTEAQYDERFREACAFLRGERPAYLKQIREKMQAAAADLDYERAIALRDMLLMLQATVKQRARVAATPAMQAEEGRRAVAELQSELALPRPPRTIEAFDISNISGTYAVASMVCAVEGIPQRNFYRRFRIESVQGSDDPAMMAEVIRRRFTRLQSEGMALPDLVLVDGGPTQLSAARAEMDRLGFTAVPAAGLAKRFEELYRDATQPPVCLPRDSAALKALQRLRDEAHRFALTYHRALRSRRIRESALDELPGVGPKKKQALLAHFGSLQRLRRATPEAIAQVAGIGPSLASEIHAVLGSGPKLG